MKWAPCDLLASPKTKPADAAPRQPNAGSRRTRLAQAEIGRHEGKTGRGMSRRKAMPTAAIHFEDIPVGDVKGRAAKRLQVPWTTGFADAFDQGHCRRGAHHDKEQAGPLACGQMAQAAPGKCRQPRPVAAAQPALRKPSCITLTIHQWSRSAKPLGSPHHCAMGMSPPCEIPRQQNRTSRSTDRRHPIARLLASAGWKRAGGLQHSTIVAALPQRSTRLPVAKIPCQLQAGLHATPTELHRLGGAGNLIACRRIFNFANFASGTRFHARTCWTMRPPKRLRRSSFQRQ